MERDIELIMGEGVFGEKGSLLIEVVLALGLLMAFLVSMNLLLGNIFQVQGEIRAAREDLRDVVNQRAVERAH